MHGEYIDNKTTHTVKAHEDVKYLSSLCEKEYLAKRRLSHYSGSLSLLSHFSSSLSVSFFPTEIAPPPQHFSTPTLTFQHSFPNTSTDNTSISMPSSHRPGAVAARPPPRLHHHHPHPPPTLPSSSLSSSSAITTTTTTSTPIAAAEEVLSDYKHIKIALCNLHKQHLLQKRQAKAEVESWRSRAEEAEAQLEEMHDLYHQQEQQQQQQTRHKEEEGQQQHEYEALCSQVSDLAEENRALQMHMLELEGENQEHRAQREATHHEVFRLQEKISEMELSLQAQQHLNVEKDIAMATLQRELKESQAREEELSAKNAALIREKEMALEAEALAVQKRQVAAAEVEIRRKLLQDRRRITEALMTEIDMVEQQVG